LASIGQTDYDIEIIISVNDNQNYSFVKKIDPRVKIVYTDQVKTGAGAARNKAISTTKAPYLAYLDADDTWSKNYLNELLPIAKENGCSFAPSMIINNKGVEVIKMPNESNHCLTPDDFSYWGASFHPVHSSSLKRGTSRGPFWENPAQDVMHAIEVILACGGSANLGNNVYYGLHLRPDSYTTTKSFYNELHSSYLMYDDILQETKAADVFLQKLNLSENFSKEAKPQETFYEYISRIRKI